MSCLVNLYYTTTDVYLSFVFFIVEISFIKKDIKLWGQFFFFLNILPTYFTHSLYLVNMIIIIGLYYSIYCSVLILNQYFIGLF